VEALDFLGFLYSGDSLLFGSLCRWSFNLKAKLLSVTLL